MTKHATASDETESLSFSNIEEATIVINGCSSCRRPIFAVPPNASPLYQKKKARNMLTQLKYANPTRLVVVGLNPFSAICAPTGIIRNGTANNNAQQITCHDPRSFANFAPTV